ncbi:hypothetical protein B0H21DRAFT_709090 [Amylocystis lapponica]|nr:hypothetical protein B0H21DRAFT_709090 [Amylocystis lapponica]
MYQISQGDRGGQGMIVVTSTCRSSDRVEHWTHTVDCYEPMHGNVCVVGAVQRCSTTLFLRKPHSIVPIGACSCPVCVGSEVSMSPNVSYGAAETLTDKGVPAQTDAPVEAVDDR